MIVALDPGKNHCGWAARWYVGCVDESFLCGYLEGSPVEIALALHALLPHGVHTLVIESMTHTHGREGSIAEDLIAVTHTGAFVGGWLRPSSVLAPTAQQWKGQVPKRIHHPRIEAAIAKRAADLAVLEGVRRKIGKGRASHMLDAIGLLQWAVEIGEK